MTIGYYYISGYWCLLIVIILMTIGCYYINGYWWIYFIGGYWWLLMLLY
jgi:hypothetical protein